MKLRTIGLSKEALMGIGYSLSSEEPVHAEAEEAFSFAETNTDIGLEAPLCSGTLLCLPRSIVLRRMERHLHTRELLVALQSDSIVFAAPPQEPQGKNLHDVRALEVKGGQAFVMERGAWHWVPFPMGTRSARFLVVFKAKTGTNDIQFQDLEEPYTVIL